MSWLLLLVSWGNCYKFGLLLLYISAYALLLMPLHSACITFTWRNLNKPLVMGFGSLIIIINGFYIASFLFTKIQSPWPFTLLSHPYPPPPPSMDSSCQQCNGRKYPMPREGLNCQLPTWESSDLPLHHQAVTEYIVF